MKTLLGVVLLGAVMVGAIIASVGAAGEMKMLRQTADNQAAPVVAARTEVTLKVAGITCASCAYTVNQALIDVPGVHNVELRATDDPTVIIAVVDCDRQLTSGEELAATTSGIGYPTEVIDNNPI